MEPGSPEGPCPPEEPQSGPPDQSGKSLLDARGCRRCSVTPDLSAGHKSQNKNKAKQIKGAISGVYLPPPG